MYRFTFLFFLGLLMMFSARAQSKKDSIEQVFTATASRLNRSIVDLMTCLQRKAEAEEANAGPYAQLSSSLDRITSLSFRCLNDLKEKIRKQEHEKVVRRYLKEFANYSHLMDRTIQVDNLDTFRQIVAFINDDLNLKYDGALASNSGQDLALVKVRVRVFNSAGTQELAGYRVFIKPEKSLNPDLVEQLNPTRNAEKLILPGRKLIWIERRGVKIDYRIEGIRSSAIPPGPIDFMLRN